MPEETLVDALATLRAEGYRADFHAEHGRLVCGGCSHALDPALVEIERVFRFEGASDPDDEAAVFGLRCGDCDLRGVYVVAYGPSMGADDAEVLPHLVKRPSN
jgi:hypothetical protein